ncbi:fimbria/pilus outer membrane usher protein [Serratia oryzae]|uniref:fimbria/pilus outer membrane usher protein n=1 Tax=Serratia oryzae TaxID=2034155 RepID=UPI0012E2FDDB|nr:fimbria/pilus outer membrane usher protein [Serratia oryzae]
MKRYPLDALMMKTLASSLLAVLVAPAWSRDYFDPDLLSIGSGPVTTDLSDFETAGHIPPGKYLVTVHVNQVAQGEYSIVFAPNRQGQTEPEFTPLLLDALGVNTGGLPQFKGLPEGKPIDSLPALIPDAFAQFNLQELRLDLSIPQIAMKPNAGGTVEPALWDNGVPAMLLNYTLSGGRNWQDSQIDSSSNTQDNLFANLRGGINWQNWRLRSNVVYTYNRSRFNGQASQQNHNTHFSNLYLQTDIRAWRSELTLGESSTGNDVFDSIPFRGVRLNSNEQMRPLNQRGFAPMLTGIANSNARITVSQNGNVIYQTYVAPGAFRINDLNQTGLGGDLTMTITESDGTVRTQTIASSSLPVMLRPDVAQYELTAGRYDGGVTVTSRQATFVSGTLIYGLPHNLTLYGGGLISRDYFSAVSGVGLSLGVLGALSADVTASSARINPEGRKSGSSYRVRYAKNMVTTGTSVDLTAYRYSTRNYYSFADFNTTGHQLSPGQEPWALLRQRSAFQIRISQQMGTYGSLYLSGMRNDYWGKNEINKSLSAGYSNSVWGVNYDVAYSISRIKGDSAWPENRQVSLNVQVPLRLFGPASALSNSYANYQISHNNNGEVQHRVGLSGSGLDDRLSWNVGQSRSSLPNSDASSTVSLGYQGSKGAANMGYSHSSHYRSLNMNGNGALVVHPQGVTLSQMLGDSLAVVSAPGAPGVKVMNGNVRTDSRGYAVVPYLANYQSNSIGLDPSTLPDDVDLTQSTVAVHPTKGAVVMAKFAPRIGLQALMTLNYGDKPLPFGTIVRVEREDGETHTGIMGDAGQVYLSGLPEQGTLTAKWGEALSQQCRARFDFSREKPQAAKPAIRNLAVNCDAMDTLAKR